VFPFRRGFSPAPTMWSVAGATRKSRREPVTLHLQQLADRRFAAQTNASNLRPVLGVEAERTTAGDCRARCALRRWGRRALRLVGGLMLWLGADLFLGAKHLAEPVAAALV
jgi:hypothetical protein